MGWHRTHELEVEAAHQVAEKCGLWTRGGLAGVEVHFEDKIIKIPHKAILDLVADEYRAQQVSKYERMNTYEVLGEMGLRR